MEKVQIDQESKMQRLTYSNKIENIWLDVLKIWLMLIKSGRETKLSHKWTNRGKLNTNQKKT